MKKLLPVILVLSMVAVVIVSGCVEQSLSGNNQTTPPPAQPGGGIGGGGTVTPPGSMECTGFHYFTFISQNVSWTGGYKLNVTNGNSQVKINGIQAGRMSLIEYPITVSADGKSALNEFIGLGKTIYIFTDQKVTDKNIGETESSFRVSILYDISGGSTGNIDNATCTAVISNW